MLILGLNRCKGVDFSMPFSASYMIAFAVIPKFSIEECLMGDGASLYYQRLYLIII